MHQSSSTERWSASEVEKLREALRTGVPITTIAASLAKDVGSVTAKIDELKTHHLENSRSESAP